MVIEEGKNALQKADVAGEIVVADNGSTDGSQEIAQNLGARVVHITHKGYGAAIDGGIKAAKGTYILFADADMSYPIIELDKMLEPLKMGTADFVLGSRLRGTIEAGAMPFLNRYLGTPFLSLLIKIFYGLKTSDCNSGMRIFHKKIYHPLQLVCTGMEYASEMLIRIGEHQIKYQEVPISFRKDRRDRPPHLKRWRDGWSHLRFILANASWSFLITIPFALSSFFLLFSFFLSLSDLWWPQKPLRLHTCFLLCGLAWPLLMFGVIQILIKSILS
jgi:glycosyltransferase involved in cell wall biosynthesis